MTSHAKTLERFVEAQAPVYAGALAEIRRGVKRSHWMWFVFPQLEGLGRSPAATFYGIRSIDEARAYLEHPLLGAFELAQPLPLFTAALDRWFAGSRDQATLRMLDSVARPVGSAS